MGFGWLPIYPTRNKGSNHHQSKRTNKQTNKLTNKLTNKINTSKQRNNQANKKKHKQTNQKKTKQHKQTNKQNNTAQANKQTNKTKQNNTSKQTNNQTNKTNKQTNKQPNKQNKQQTNTQPSTNKQTNRQNNKQVETNPPTGQQGPGSIPPSCRPRPRHSASPDREHAVSLEEKRICISRVDAQKTVRTENFQGKGFAEFPQIRSCSLPGISVETRKRTFGCSLQLTSRWPKTSPQLFVCHQNNLPIKLQWDQNTVQTVCLPPKLKSSVTKTAFPKSSKSKNSGSEI